MKGGGEGLALESRLLALDRGFELEDIDLGGRELTIWHGRLDVNCPIRMAEKAASLLKGVKMVFLDEEAHSLVAHQTKAIVRSLLVQPSYEIWRQRKRRVRMFRRLLEGFASSHEKTSSFIRRK
jgi:hypothetical protein